MQGQIDPRVAEIHPSDGGIDRGFISPKHATLRTHAGVDPSGYVPHAPSRDAFFASFASFPFPPFPHFTSLSPI